MSETLEKIRHAASDLHPTTLAVLVDMYELGVLRGTESDQPVVIDKITRIRIEQGAMLNRLMREHSVKCSLEVGLAYGFSTVWMLDALRAQPNSAHTAIDPFQKTSFGGIGLAQAARLGGAVRFEWLPDYSIHALSDLIRQGRRFDFIYIDGNHRFDDVIVDFYLSDQLLRPGGLIVLDDMWMSSIQTAGNFIVQNRAYKPVPQPVENIMVLEKIRDDNRDWRHFNRFEVHDGSNNILKKVMKRFKRLLRW